MFSLVLPFRGNLRVLTCTWILPLLPLSKSRRSWSFVLHPREAACDACPEETTNPEDVQKHTLFILPSIHEENKKTYSQKRRLPKRIFWTDEPKIKKSSHQIFLIPKNPQLPNIQQQFEWKKSLSSIADSCVRIPALLHNFHFVTCNSSLSSSSLLLLWRKTALQREFFQK